MSAGDVKRAVIKELDQNSETVKAILTPPLTAQKVLDFITEAIELVEVLSPDNITGEQKKAIVSGVIEWANEKFGITDAILCAIIPRWLRWLPFKRIATRLFPILIDFIVSVLNRYVWKKAD